MNNEPNPAVATSARTRRTVSRKHMLAVPVLIAVLAGSAVGVNATDDTDPDDTELDGLVTEEVEPGVERIISDGAGHDLDETHPDFHYDMDDVVVMPDGAIWLWSSYHETDNEANPEGGLLWVLGEPGMTTTPDPGLYCYVPDSHIGVRCWDPVEQAEIPYLASVHINAVAIAPDGTAWAVGDHDGENGALYHITPDLATDAAPTTT